MSETDDHDKLIALNTKFESKLESVDRWRIAVQTNLDSQRKDLYGNGKPGWDEMLRDITKRMMNVEKRLDDIQVVDANIKLMGIKMSAETRLALINGAFILLSGIFTTWWLGR